MTVSALIVGPVPAAAYTETGTWRGRRPWPRSAMRSPALGLVSRTCRLENLYSRADPADCSAKRTPAPLPPLLSVARAVGGRRARASGIYPPQTMDPIGTSPEGSARRVTTGAADGCLHPVSLRCACAVGLPDPRQNTGCTRLAGSQRRAGSARRRSAYRRVTEARQIIGATMPPRSAKRRTREPVLPPSNAHARTVRPTVQRPGPESRPGRFRRTIWKEGRTLVNSGLGPEDEGHVR